MNVMAASASDTPHPPKYDGLIARAKSVPSVSAIAVHPCDESSLRGVVDTAQARHHRSNSGGTGDGRSRKPRPSTIST